MVDWCGLVWCGVVWCGLRWFSVVWKFAVVRKIPLCQNRALTRAPELPYGAPGAKSRCACGEMVPHHTSPHAMPDHTSPHAMPHHTSPHAMPRRTPWAQSQTPKKCWAHGVRRGMACGLEWCGMACGLVWCGNTVKCSGVGWCDFYDFRTL